MRFIKFIETFAGQHWSISPVALTLNAGKPVNMHLWK